jgi:subtilisin family serine protease
MDTLNFFKKLLILIFSLITANITVYAELPEELRKEVIAFIRVGYLEFPEQESSALPLGSVTVNSVELSDAFALYGVETIQRGFPEFTDDDTLRTSETGYSFVIPQFSRIFRIQLSSETLVDSLIKALQQLPEVIAYAEKNSEVELAQVIPNDNLFSSQWGLKNTGNPGGTPGADIKATFAWMLYKGNPQIKVGIFDTGVDQLQPDLNSRISGESHSPIGNQCDYSHGTHVAGLIGACTNNSIGIAGVDWSSQLISYQLFNPYGFIGDVNASNKIIQAVNSGVNILNNSWGNQSWAGQGGMSLTLQLAFVYAYKMNSISVAALGNNQTNQPYYPAAFQDVPIAVGATDWDDQYAWRYSNYGWSNRVVAPGGYSEFPCPQSFNDPKDILSTWTNSSYQRIAGTSMAAPLVSGLAALIKGKRMSLYNDDVKNIIYFSADDLLPAGWDELYGYGRINTRRAIEFTSSPYNFSYLSTSGAGATVTVEPDLWQMFSPWSIPGLHNGVNYQAKKHRVKKQISIPNTISNVHIWGRGNQSTGYNGYLITQHGMGYTYASLTSQNTAELQTFVYFVKGGGIGPIPYVEDWFPSTGSNVNFAYTLHGISRWRTYAEEDRQQVGGCPWIFVHNTSDTSWFVGDNNIMHRSEIPEFYGQDLTDVYKLNVVPNLTDQSEFSIKLIETEKDYGYIDKVSFKAIDHPTGTEIGVTESNDIVLFDIGDRSSSDSANLNSSNNITRYIRYDYSGSVKVTGNASDSIVAADFEDGLPPSGDSVAVIMSISNNQNLASDQQVKDYAGEISLYVNSSPMPTVKKFSRRENSSVIIIPLGDSDALIDSATINWYRDYELDYLFVAPVTYTGYSVQEIPMISAIHSSEGDVLSKVNSIDQNYGNIDSISMITLTFSNITAPQSGYVRDYVFECTGRYESSELTEGDQILRTPENLNVPLENKLFDNYPNPFNPMTSIKFSIKSDRFVKVMIYDILGRLVGAPVNEFKQKGSYQVSFDGSNLASGVYFYRIEAGDFVQSKKMVLVK